MHWLAQAPANIALIKYMGKQDEGSNLPDNSSLSYTLNNLLSTVRLEPLPGASDDVWEPLTSPDTKAFDLSLAGQTRFLQHLKRLKTYFGCSHNFLVQSNNNFPHGSGLASSASSFAALTQCAMRALSELTHKELPSVEEQADWSRRGSGSSCRSFFSPWALWKGNEVSPVDLPYKGLIHQVIVINSSEKKVSSSEAHKRVKSSALYSTRSQRAEERLELLLHAFAAKDWPAIYEICWTEFQDMHHLFHTCEQPFSYITEESTQVLNLLESNWSSTGDGPIVTMDAGPNIHLLYRIDQLEYAHQFKVEHLIGNYEVL